MCYGSKGRTIVFTSTKADANNMNMPMHHEVMHGDISQHQREITLRRFKENRFQVLVATDVAARGIDIPNIELVVQLEPPKDTENYIHRSGRTARAGNSGTCITFYNRKNEEFLQRIEQMAGIKMEKVRVPSQAEIKAANKRDILKELSAVNHNVLPNY